MRGLSRKLIAVAGSITLVGIGAGVSAASASPSSPAVTGVEHFYLMTTQPSEAKLTVVATGLFTAGGVDTSDSAHSVDVLKFANGSFKVHSPGQPKIIKQQVNTKTCFGAWELQVKATLGNGTGAYKGISGSATAIVNQVSVFPRTKGGQCNMNALPSTNEESIAATAHVKL